MYLAFKREICDLSMFTPLFSSDIALYSQILSDIEVGILLLTSGILSSGTEIFSYKTVYDSLNARLPSLNGLCTSEPIFHDVNSSNPGIIANNLNILAKCLREKINAAVNDWLARNNIDIYALAKS
jgi:hypothetical protein